MEHSQPNPYVKVNSSKCILKSELLSLLKTYNCYHEGKSFQLRHREEEGELIIEGLLNISWGLKRPIRLQMQDDNERIWLPSSGQWKADQSGFLNRCESKDRVMESNNNAVNSAISLKPDINSCEEEIPQLMRTKSDASFMVQRRTNSRSSGEVQKIKRHRFSINGHFYNHKTSVFTPAYGSITNVRVNSTMTTPQVLSLLLNKFKVESSPHEFALYLVHESGERSKLKDTEYPLICRILHGPCEKIAKIFLMEADLGEEVPYDVAQYIKFEMPVLDSFVEKLKEEEEREISKLTLRFSVLRLMIQQHLEKLVDIEDHV
ncbi:ras association domain-containing protein 4 isoform X2 [Microcaecilia unicolor]|uniref:Ras association domain-containing protein 4 isoform X2 n=1 Tax=Microcaecilia unicolor TaxID=1415580 RepID=A0A6P7Y8C3_9AMPH|nr:ras association domain-containing protein 4 isoform X2 [Microcaecilia unicolor]